MVVADDDDGRDFDSTACAYARAVEEVLDSRFTHDLRPWRWFRDPHLIEILQTLVEAIDEARFAARCANSPHAPAVREALGATLQDCERAKALRRESAAELLDTVMRAVIRLADDAYLEAADASRLDGRPSAREQPAGGLDEGEGERIRGRLLDARRRNAHDQRRLWTRLRLKRRLMWRYAAGMAVAVLATAAAIRWAGAERTDIAVALSAGALGSSLSGLLKLRDELSEGKQIVAFAAIGSAQVAVGAAGGLFVLFLVELDLLGLPGTSWASVGALAFAAGFSEPFLLGTVRGIAQAPKEHSTRDKPGVARDCACREEPARTSASR